MKSNCFGFRSAFISCLTIALVCISSLASLGDTREVTHEETVTGGSSASLTASTSGPLTAAAGHLYLAAISARPNVAAASVAGLGLTWTRVLTQCSGRNQTGVELWMALGTPTGDDQVTATFNSAPNGAAIIVSRYSGVDAKNPLGVLVSGNTAGGIGACSGGVDNATYSFNLTASSGAMVYGVSASRNRTNTPGLGFTKRGELLPSGTAGTGLAVQEKSVTATGAVTFAGTMNGAADWVAVALEIKPQFSTSPTDIGVKSNNLPPTEFALEVNNAEISYSLPVPAVVRVNIYDGTGKLVRVITTGEMAVGRYSSSWNKRDNYNRFVAMGAYLYQMVAESEDGQVLFTQTRRMTLLK